MSHVNIRILLQNGWMSLDFADVVSGKILHSDSKIMKILV